FGYIGNNDGVTNLADYNRVDSKIQYYFLQFRALPCNVIFTAWEDIKELTSNTGEKYTLAFPKLRNKTADIICGLCDIVGHIIFNNGERIIMLESTPNAIAKDRIFKRKSCKFEEIINHDQLDI
ncbi:MAG: AAA family ATPase, partial [Synergistaceae bacterium]|nr:AAA family ATPase [Synergistaceae bacterium]